ncbi:WXG100 family type VII secretion target [Clostridium brassicae]|uniref:WXG100 family type VII secretion target n=1 Tax=Clostridium brassicae TaxID=2999072 RepID=A0ABT4D6U2_9CLOT|nr:hypothetical protein [Clostridium brassicae]MCY6958015.1 hypothetical protein [Clostridium brassicae]
MAGISNSNFYIDNTSLDTLKKSYNKSIQNLTQLYFDFESEVNNIESKELWKGESFDKFKKNFDDWKMEYLKKLSELVQLKEFIEEVKSTSEMLIEQRDSLKFSLEV